MSDTFLLDAFLLDAFLLDAFLLDAAVVAPSSCCVAAAGALLVDRFDDRASAAEISDDGTVPAAPDELSSADADARDVGDDAADPKPSAAESGACRCS